MGMEPLDMFAIELLQSLRSIMCLKVHQVLSSTFPCFSKPVEMQAKGSTYFYSQMRTLKLEIIRAHSLDNEDNVWQWDMNYEHLILDLYFDL